MTEILFLSHRIPFPPDRGDKIRSHHILKRLAGIAPVHVATFADDDRDMDHEAELAAVSKSYRLIRRSKPLAIAGFQALASSEPVSLTAFHHQSLSQYVEKVLATRPVAAVYVFSGQMGQYVPKTYAGRVIADFVDVDSAKFDAYAAGKSGLRSWIDAREGRMLRAEEARLAQRANVSLLISSEEMGLFKSRLPDAIREKVPVRVLANGIDSDEFDPAIIAAEQQMLGASGPRLIFTGQMDYPPNIEAACRAIDRLLPEIRQVYADATLHIVGRNPPQRLLSRHGRNGVHVWGQVPDMRSWLRAAEISLVPLEIGRGVQNKVLEAMAMGLPVVLTPEAATGIGASDGDHFRIAQSDDALINATIELARDARMARRMGAAARQYVIDNASWKAALSSLPEIVGLTRQGDRDAA